MKIKLVPVMKSQQGESHSRDFPHSKDEKFHIRHRSLLFLNTPFTPKAEQQDVNIGVLERAELVSVPVHVPR